MGLGNPGREYQDTRHNLGFMLIDRLMERAGSGRFRRQSQADVAEVTLARRRVVLAKPQTFMNLSGESVRPLVARYCDGDAAKLIAASDDVALPLGMIRIRPRGSAGGQKGLRSIIDQLGTQQFTRLRLGVGPDHPVEDLSGFVLSRIPRRDRKAVDEMLDRAADAVEVVLIEGVERAMSLFNQRKT